jgi:DegV family protein with EDD domain
VQVYRDLAAAGATGAVSIHLSGELSGTVDAARIAARTMIDEGFPVQVLDSRSLGMGLGFAVLAAAHQAIAGADAEQVARLADQVALASRAWLYVDDLEYLRRGGRVNAAVARLGTALAVKPLLYLMDGRIELLERVRTTSRALIRLEELVLARATGQPVDLAVHHLDAAERATELATRLAQRLPVRQLVVSELGAAVGAHAGPGAVGVVIAPVPR